MNKGTASAGFVLSFVAGGAIMWGVDRGSGDHKATRDDANSVVVEPPGANPIAVGGEGQRGAKPGAVAVDLHVMAQCPYGVQAENALKDAVTALGSDVDFRVHFIGQTTPAGELSSMHGPNELAGDTAQACAMKYTPKWFDLVLCQNKSPKDVATNWTGCARENGIAVDAIKACTEGSEGKALVAASFKRSADQGVTGSPTLFINGKKYEGGRKPAEYFRAICGAYGGNKPAACSNIPEPPKVNVTVLGDKRCTECDTRRLLQQVNAKVGNPVVKNLDYGDAEGKKLFAAIKPANLPLVVFDASLDADKDAFAALSRGLRPAGDLKVLAAGAWNPACADDGGCDLPECKSALQCRPEAANKLEVFVMSQCPFGVRGLDAMKEVLDNFGKHGAALDFSVHFIGDGDAQTGLKSMHGQGEVDEDLREVCAIEHYGKDLRYMDYVWCRNKSIKDPNWQACTGAATGIDAEVIRTCAEGDEGKALLAKSFAYSKAAGMNASPTWLANNKFKFSGVDAQAIKTNICSHNALGGCDATLSGPPAPPAGAAKGGTAAPGCGG